MNRAAGLLAVAALLAAACGGSSPSPQANQPRCASGLDAGAENPADLQSEFTFAGRHAAGIDTFFGSDSADILDQADQLQAGVAQDVAGQLGVTPVDVQLPGASCGSALHAGLDAGTVHAAYRNMALDLSMAVIANFIQYIPFTIPPNVPSPTVDGYRESTAGDPAIKVWHEVTVNGDRSKIIVEAKGTLSIVSSRSGSIMEVTKVHIDLDVCPDAGGGARGNVTFNLDGSTTPAGGGAGTSYSIATRNTFAYLLNDQAEVASVPITGSSSFTSNGAETNQLSADASWTTDTSLHGGQPAITQQTGTGSAKAQTIVGKELLKPAENVAVVAAAPARKKWQDGTCVEVKVDRPSGTVHPQEKIHLTATVHQKFENVDLQVPVVGKLKGNDTLDPGPDPVPAPAAYDFQAGDGGETGELTFTSTSRRGIGSQTITLAAEGCGSGSGSCWTGQLSIQVGGSMNESLDSTSPDGTYTGNDDIEATYAATIFVISDASGTLHASSGTINGMSSHTLTKTGSGQDHDCSWTSDDEINGSWNGTLKLNPGDGYGSVYVEDGGMYQVSFSPPPLTIEGSTRSYGSSTNTGAPACMPSPPYDMSVEGSSMLNFTLNGMGSYDPANPMLTGSDQVDGMILGLPANVTYSWSLSMQ